MLRTDNPVRDADRKARSDSAWLRDRPLCYACGEPIQEDTCLGWNGHKYHCDCKDGWADDAALSFMEVTI